MRSEVRVLPGAFVIISLEFESFGNSPSAVVAACRVRADLVENGDSLYGAFEIHSDPVTDESLLALAAQGDFAAFQQLVTRFQSRVFGVAFRIVGQKQDAEDVTQQTFLSLVEKVGSFRGESSVATWILRIATNHALKLLRKKRGLPVVPLDRNDSDDSYATLPHPEYIAKWTATPEALAEQVESQELIESALNSLDDKYRVVFVLRDIEGMSVRETAEALGLTEGTVKVRLLRARLMLRERLTREFGDEATRLFPDHEHG